MNALEKAQTLVFELLPEKNSKQIDPDLVSKMNDGEISNRDLPFLLSGLTRTNTTGQVL